MEKETDGERSESSIALNKKKHVTHREKKREMLNGDDRQDGTGNELAGGGQRHTRKYC